MIRCLLIGAFCVPVLAQTAAWQEPLAQHRWAEAETLLKQSLARGDSPAALRALAQVYRASGRLEDADPLLERLAAMEESASNIEDLARVKAGLGKLDRAEALYRRALELIGTKDRSAAIPVHQRLAQVLFAQMKFSGAEQEALLAISFRASLPGARHPELADDNTLLARIFEAQKKWQDAASVWETVAAIQAETLGEENLRLADTLDSLALCRFQMESFDQAEFAWRRVLAIRQLNLGSSSVEVAQTAGQLGMLFFHTKRYADAEPFYRRSLDVILALPSADPLLLVRCYDNLAVDEAMLPKIEEAERLYREALKLRDAEDVTGLHNLGLILVARSKPAEAEPLYSRALAILDAAAKANPDLLMEVLSEYASLLRELNRPAEASKLEARLNGGQPMALPKQRAKQTAK